MRHVHKGDKIIIMGFNPRTRKGCDPKLTDRSLINHGFNPRTRKGCDVPFVTCILVVIRFQSTHP